MWLFDSNSVGKITTDIMIELCKYSGEGFIMKNCFVSIVQHIGYFFLYNVFNR